jgi:histidyl-tRNA synthetase
MTAGNKRFQAVKGTRDLLPLETAVWAAVENVARRVFGLYGFGEIRTPIFEETELFARGVGESSDIVSKEMYSFVDRGGRNLTLRPENTASVVRAYVQHGMHALPQPVKLFYIGPQFRAENVQKGRYRQFHQIGAEWIGAGGTRADVEVIEMLWRFFVELGFADLTVRINTVGDRASRSRFRKELVSYLRPKILELSEDSQRRLLTNPLRILDSKDSRDHAALLGAPDLSDCMSEESVLFFNDVCGQLQNRGIHFVISPKLVRGLDYYTNTVFEIVSEGLGSQNAICGGGAYEGLVEELGGQPTYGVGFAIGEDRLIEVLPEATRAAMTPRGPVLLRALGSSIEVLAATAALAEELRAVGIPALDLGEETPQRTFAHADHRSSPAILILGEDELKTHCVTVRTTADRKQVTVDRSELVAMLSPPFGGAAGKREP